MEMFVNNEFNKPDKTQVGIIYAMDIEQIIDDSIYPSLVASGGTCTSDCSSCWTNECDRTSSKLCGRIQGSSGQMYDCYRN